MLWECFVDVNGEPLDDDAVTIRRGKRGQLQVYIRWWRITSAPARPEIFNEIMDLLEPYNNYLERKEGCKEITEFKTLQSGYYLKQNGTNMILSGIRKYGEEQWQVFRYVTSKEQIGHLPAGECIKEFNRYFEEYTGTTFDKAFGSIPDELHQYRHCVPNPIDWAFRGYVTKEFEEPRILKDITKADVSSAYGYELTKELPNMNDYKVLDGRVEPNERYPFAFYLTSGNMAIYNEGSTWDYWDMIEFSEIKKMSLGITVPDKRNEKDLFTGKWKDQTPEYDKTLLCAGIKVDGLEEMIRYLYDGRKKHPENKDIMNISVGCWWSRNTETSNGYKIPVRWPLTAVVHYRCNARIAKWLKILKDHGQAPALVNTDSISWRGNYRDICEPKSLGSFSLEYTDAEMIIVGVKEYQILYYDFEAGDYDTLTRWSGYRKDFTKNLPFGAVCDPKTRKKFIDHKEKVTYKWDWERRRYINQKGEIYTGVDTNEKDGLQEYVLEAEADSL